MPLSGVPDSEVRPEFRNALPRAIRKDRSGLEQLTLPRIVGVQHTAENLGEALRVVRSLEPNSKLGLEHWSGSFPHTLEASAGRFFVMLEQTARELGHEVVYLERRNSRFGPLEQQLMQLQEQRLALPFSRPWLWLPVLAKEALFALKNIRALRREQNERVAWRSLIMARNILRENWSQDDAVICGTTHAVHIGDVLNTSAFRLVRQYEIGSVKTVDRARDLLRKHQEDRGQLGPVTPTGGSNES